MERHRNILGVCCLLSLIIGQVIVTVSSQCETGIHVDDGYNQARVEQCLSTEQKTVLEYSILERLGLPQNLKNLEKKTIMKRSGPKFLLDVYNNEVEYKQWNNNGEFKLSEKNSYAINQSDQIISFMAQQPHHGEGGKPDKVKRMWFDVSAVPVIDDIIMSAELRLYRGSEFNKKKHSGAFIIKVYRALRPADGKRDKHFVASVDITAGYTGWITLNVSEPLQFWTKNPEKNQGLYILVHPAGGTESDRTKAEEIGIIGFDGDAEKQPFMVGFYKDPAGRKILRRLEDPVTRHPRSAPVDSEDAMHYMEPIDPDGPIFTGPCELRKLSVNFKNIQWHKSVLAPEEFEASYCSGECIFPLQTRMNSTNHAIVQALMHMVNHSVPKPCCAPRKYSELDVIYFQDEDHAIYKRFQDMVVDECGCS